MKNRLLTLSAMIILLGAGCSSGVNNSGGNTTSQQTNNKQKIDQPTITPVSADRIFEMKKECQSDAYDTKINKYMNNLILSGYDDKSSKSNRGGAVSLDKNYSSVLNTCVFYGQIVYSPVKILDKTTDKYCSIAVTYTFIYDFLTDEELYTNIREESDLRLLLDPNAVPGCNNDIITKRGKSEYKYLDYLKRLDEYQLKY
jgi:hypothetical protein